MLYICSASSNSVAASREKKHRKFEPFLITFTQIERKREQPQFVYKGKHTRVETFRKGTKVITACFARKFNNATREYGRGMKYHYQ